MSTKKGKKPASKPVQTKHKSRGVALAGPTREEADTLLWYCNSGRFDFAEKIALSFTQRFPSHPFGWYVRGQIFAQTGDFQAALGPMQEAARLAPNDAEARNDLGIVLNELGRPADAEMHQREAIRLVPDSAVAYNNLGNTLKNLGRLTDAETSFRNAIRLKPDLAEAHNNLGNICIDLRRLADAQESFREAIRLRPDYADAYNNLAVLHLSLERLTDAEEGFRSAIRLRPDFTGAQSNLGLVLLAKGDTAAALDIAVKTLRFRATDEGKKLLVDCIRKARPTIFDESLCALACSALREAWGRPSDIVGFACHLVKFDPKLQSVFNALIDGSEESFSIDNASIVISRGDFASASLLNEILCSAPVSDRHFEKLLTGLRQDFLQKAITVSANAVSDMLPIPFYCALARQCFINEYIFFQTPEEIEKSTWLRNRLTEALKHDQPIPASWVIAVGCYFPLFSLGSSEELLRQVCSADVKSVLIQQVQEPQRELDLRSTIPDLTSVENGVSLAVQSQYEEHPYPRWTRMPQTGKQDFLNSYIRQKFPLAKFKPVADDRAIEVMVAGCGTGQDPITTAQSFKGARILAIDLSTASLAYAKRKTLELGIDSIEYAHADILKLVSVGRTFDVVEATGVLHHLEKPYEGWKALLNLLRPNGFMRLGFYSELARRDIVQIRQQIAGQGVGSSSEDIRNFRQEIAHFGGAVTNSDFYSTSACRDLLFHVQEHRMSLDSISDFLKHQDLTFLGFDIDPSVIGSYRERFPNDPSATNLEQWHIYETENPDTFRAMYQFWIQKTESSRLQ